MKIKTLLAALAACMRTFSVSAQSKAPKREFRGAVDWADTEKVSMHAAKAAKRVFIFIVL